MIIVNLTIITILINQIFSKVIIKISNCFTILIMAVFMHGLDIEREDSAMNALSFGFVVPGLMFIITGESLIEKN